MTPSAPQPPDGSDGVSDGTTVHQGPRLEGDATRLGRRAGGSLVALFLLVALGALSTMVGLPYIVLKPGPVTNTLGTHGGSPLVTVSGARTYPTAGALDFTTVRLAGGPGSRITVWDLLHAALSPSEEVESEETYFPKGVTSKQVEEEGAAEMVNSQQEAVAVALTALGEDVPQRVVIARVADDAPSKALLRAGDVIATVDGKPVSDGEGIRAIVGVHRPGETVRLGLVRGGKAVSVEAGTRASQGRATVGVFLGLTFQFPYEVKINAGEVVGPSAGTMFALAVYDTLTPGALTGGKQVAGTGTIDASGKVGPIGGIRQKLVGARDGGAAWFLAPADNCSEVVGHVPDGLRVVRIRTFDEARSAVQAVAAGRADDLPTCG